MFSIAALIAALFPALLRQLEPALAERADYLPALPAGLEAADLGLWFLRRYWK